MNLDYVRALTFAPIKQTYDARDCALYALSLGMGEDPLDEDELPYVYEGRGPLAAPGQCAILCWPPFWHQAPEAGIAWRHILHGEQSFVLHKPLPSPAPCAPNIALSPSRTRARAAPSSPPRTISATTPAASPWRACSLRSSCAATADRAASVRPRR